MLFLEDEDNEKFFNSFFFIYKYKAKFRLEDKRKVSEILYFRSRCSHDFFELNTLRKDGIGKEVLGCYKSLTEIFSKIYSGLDKSDFNPHSLYVKSLTNEERNKVILFKTNYFKNTSGLKIYPSNVFHTSLCMFALFFDLSLLLSCHNTDCILFLFS